SSTLLIREAGGKLAGALCINLDTTRVQSQIDYLRQWLPPEKEAEDRSPTHPQPEHIADMVTGLISSIIGEQPPEQMTREERLAKVRFMEEKGIFLMKGSIELAAERLGVKEVTIYSYLDELRRQKK
ncbi:MAG: helix-turn-helix domain-containing protein, partial [Clostridia bacterium]|nr:helix-turn-helix domain-containing protein [Clostridia bacterium]